MAWHDCQLCLECCHSSLWKGARRTQTPLSSVQGALCAHACVGDLCRTAAKGRGCAQDACAAGRTGCAPKRLLLFAWQPSGRKTCSSICVLRCCWGCCPFPKAGLAAPVAVARLRTEYLLSPLNCIGKDAEDFLPIPGWKYCGVIAQKCFILRLIFWSLIVENKPDADSVIASVSYHVSVEQSVSLLVSAPFAHQPLMCSPTYSIKKEGKTGNIGNYTASSWKRN